MPVTSDARPVIARPGVVSALVSTIRTHGPADQQRAAAEAAARWRRGPWPSGLAAVSVFRNLDGRSVLVYEQWADRDALRAGDRRPLSGADAAPVEYQLYRTVPGGGVPSPPPPAACFPVAFFVIEPGESGRGKIDQMLAAEEQKAGTRRDYPGGIAAHMHVSADDTSVLVLSEWVSEELHTAHIEDIWKELLAEGGHRALTEGAPATGDRYWHHATVTGPDAAGEHSEESS
jgi:quinol monooxygenase YgiN